MRILSYNIHKGVGGRDRRYNLARTIAAIEHENPDIIGLQEVDCGCRRSKFEDQPVLLCNYFRAEGNHYQLNVPSGNGCYGNLIFSRWPIIEHLSLSIRLGRRKPRGAQIVVIDSPEGPLLIVHTHLGLAERERRWQVALILEHERLRATDNLPTVVFGDLNDWRNQLSRQLVREYGFQQITAPPSRFRSFPAWLPMGSLDKAFCRHGFVVSEARISHSPMAKVASDHLPLVVDFHLAGVLPTVE